MVTALILSGGTGTRLGANIPKQYIEVDGRPIISYCFETLALSRYIDAIWIVADEHWQEYIEQKVKPYDIYGRLRGFSSPGANRQLSIFNGLSDIRNELEKTGVMPAERGSVLVHDAARPLLSEGLIARCVEGAKGHAGAMPVLPMKDTVYLSNDGVSVSELLDRSRIFAGQAPELFDIEKYYAANVRLLPDKIMSINGSTEPAVMAGMDIAMVTGDENNFKITTMEDLERFKQKTNI